MIDGNPFFSIFNVVSLIGISIIFLLIGGNQKASKRVHVYFLISNATE